jgi:hypothetical protein
VDNEKFEITQLMQTDDGVGEQGLGKDQNSLGPYIVAAISERKKFKASEITTNAGKILVVGNANFISNGIFKILGNRIVWFGISDYMLYEENTDIFAEVKIENYGLVLSKKQFTKLIFRIASLPITLLVLAIFTTFPRRE